MDSKGKRMDKMYANFEVVERGEDGLIHIVVTDEQWLEIIKGFNRLQKSRENQRKYESKKRNLKLGGLGKYKNIFPPSALGLKLF